LIVGGDEPMDRRTLWQGATAIPLLAALRRPAAALAAPANRVRPSDPAWPDAASWERLRRQLGGRLVKVQSPLAACRSAPDSAACRALIEELRNPYFIGDQPGLTQSSGWVDAWISQPSVYAVAARTAGDVAAAVAFARRHNLRLVVKGGGHSYQGTCDAADSLLIWTRAMNHIALHDGFVGHGCGLRAAPQPAVSIEAGAMWIDAYDTVTTKAGRYVQGGGCATVGVAGLVQSGGFGSFSKNFGTAAAGLLEAEIVTADGAVRIANPCTNPELFWAIRGGGGGSFGVATRLTLRTRPLPIFFGGAFLSIKANSDDAFRRLISRFVGFYRESLFNPHWGESVAFGSDNTLAVTMVCQGLDKAQATAVWRPFLDWLAQSPKDFVISRAPLIGVIPARSWWDAAFREKNLPNTVHRDPRPGAPAAHVWWAGNQNEVGIFWHGYESAWLPAALLAQNQAPRLAAALFAASRHWRVALHFNKGLAGAPAEAIAAANDTATNPAMLEAFALAIIAGGQAATYPGIRGHEPDLPAARAAAGRIDDAMQELRQLVPAPAAYLSESNFFERSWQEAFWGPNYARLQAVKKKYDPDGLFFVHHGVGSEEWSADGFTRLAAIDRPSATAAPKRAPARPIEK
jgi:FAD/FMN-containing dehydrogenase